MPASDPSPARRAADRLRGALAQAGVRVEGTVRAGDAPTPASGSAITLAEYRSPPLESLLADVLTDSHNWYADMLALTLGLEVAGTGRFDDGVGVVSDFVNGLAESAAAPVRDEVWLVDGSGLSPANLVTPSAIVRLLAHAVSRPWGAVLIDALATPGAGTLRSWPRLPPAAAKTGTLRHTVALAGFLRPRSATPLPFCYFVNHRPGRPAPARREIAASLRAWSAGGP